MVPNGDLAKTSRSLCMLSKYDNSLFDWMMERADIVITKHDSYRRGLAPS